MRIVMLSVALFASVPVFANDNVVAANSQTTTSQDQSEKAEQLKDKKICKRIDSSESRMSKRVCMTSDQWKKQQSEQL